MQRFAKAYPGLRELEVLKNYALGSAEPTSIVASICPKVPIGSETDPNFGYNPAVRAIIDQLKVHLQTRCLPRPLETDEQGLVPCAVVEAVKGGDCNRRGRVPAPELAHAAIRKQLEESGECKGDCSSYALCEILPAGKAPDGSVDPARLDACQMGKPLSDEIGYCYVDEAKKIGKGDLVKECPAEERRMLRFIGDDTPAKGALTFIACVGESAS